MIEAKTTENKYGIEISMDDYDYRELKWAVFSVFSGYMYVIRTRAEEMEEAGRPLEKVEKWQEKIKRVLTRELLSLLGMFENAAREEEDENGKKKFKENFSVRMLYPRAIYFMTMMEGLGHHLNRIACPEPSDDGVGISVEDLWLREACAILVKLTGNLEACLMEAVDGEKGSRMVEMIMSTQDFPTVSVMQMNFICKWFCEEKRKEVRDYILTLLTYWMQEELLYNKNICLEKFRSDYEGTIGKLLELEPQALHHFAGLLRSAEKLEEDCTPEQYEKKGKLYQDSELLKAEW